MVDTCVGPSELHLKKELSAFGKSRFLRDPDTRTSWKSPLGSNSSNTNFNLNIANENSENKKGMNILSDSLELPSGFEKRRRNVYLYNWGHHSSKSSESAFQLDDDKKQASVHETEESMNNTLSSGVKGKNLDMILRRNSRKSSRGVALRKRNKKNSATTTKMSDDSGYCSSEESQQESKHKLTQIIGSSQCASPIFSSFSCTPASNRSKNIHRTPMDRPRGSWEKTSDSSPSLSDTPSKMVRRILCGSRTMHYSKRRASNSNIKHKHKHVPNSSPGLPLLNNSFDGLGTSEDSATDELATNFSELDLEAISRLDGRIWSTSKSQEVNMVEEKCLSHKYRPRSFDEIVGQSIVVQSLKNAIMKGRIAPAYLFLGPRGTGKTSTVRVLAATLNCSSTEENRPCLLCDECSNFGSNIKEVDANNKKDIGKIRLLLKKLHTSETFSRYKIFVIDDCHMLSSNSWSALIKFLEEPFSRVVFVFVTTEPDSLPRSVVSRCQKFFFPKIKDGDIAFRLRKLSAEENLDVEWDALDLIASNSDGSLQDAETMLDQLSLLGKKITTSIVNDLLGVVSDEKLLYLLEVALASDTAETVKTSKELMESGIDPVALMSQLATLIMDIIAGTYRLPKSRSSSTVFSGQSLAESEMEKLQRALKILSNAEKQLRVSGERSTWFTAALLQLGSCPSPHLTPSCSSSCHSIKRLALENPREISSSENKSNPSLKNWESSSGLVNRDDATSVMVPRCVSPNQLDEIWRKCIEKCDSEILRNLLYAHGKLVLITESKGDLIAYVVFGDINLKCKAEQFLRNITNSIAIVLKHSVEVRIGLVPEYHLKVLKSLPDSPSSLQTISNELPRRSVDYSRSKLRRTSINEQRLESAWLQAVENGEASLVSHSKEREQEIHNLTQNGLKSINQFKTMPELSISFKHWKDGESDEIEEIETNDCGTYHKEQVGGYQHAISPSLLHSNSYRTEIDRQSLGYESGPVGSNLCCWKTSKSNSQKAKQANHAKPQEAGGCFGLC